MKRQTHNEVDAAQYTRDLVYSMVSQTKKAKLNKAEQCSRTKIFSVPTDEMRGLGKMFNKQTTTIYWYTLTTFAGVS